MNKEVLEAVNFDDLDELIVALTDLRDMAKRIGYRGGEVYVSHNRVTLVSEVLTDGSRVLNLHLFQTE